MFVSQDACNKIAEVILRCRTLALALRGHFDIEPGADGDALQMQVFDCLKGLEELQMAANACVSVVLVAAGEKKIELIKEVHALTGAGLKEAKDLIEAAPTIVTMTTDVAEAKRTKFILERAGAAVEMIPSDWQQ